ncbi:MAG: RNA 2',3'-cyclic phosphodiesterase [Thermodesulfobacteriota bacterium]|nr:RNA 2',3'-cyclic phosphodiesterase [Thermodesulfobacteriota bacterium]
MADKIRAFIAISLPESVLQAIGEAQDRLRRSRLDIRWVRKEGIHLTLKFLGDIDRGAVEKLDAAMGRATKGIPSFVLMGEGIGVFPDLRRARVIWAGVSGDVRALMALYRNLESELKGLGFPKEKRTYRGHLTLGRAKGRLDTTALMQALEGLRDFQTASFSVPSLVLFQSTLRPQGAIYTRLAEAPLVSD